MGGEPSSRARESAPQQATYERHAVAASGPLARTCCRREPHKTVLHSVVREHLDAFLSDARRRDGEGYPHLIEYRRYLDRGLLEQGFARLRCTKCAPR